ncbi:GntR family transcriptional repressor for pyruvate dehydrogenase complex [Bacillus fengqiuensis]|nr:GntR family transcriptional repressor for pyruvate dehydrogenase complex [Bacillus fengqiuensis]
MNVEKISPKKVSDSVAEQIEKMIESEMFKAGEKLPSVRELCELFDVGRSAVRDAITTLKGKGMVKVKQGEGTFVCEFDSTRWFPHHLLLPNSKDIRELFQVRKIVETGIVEMAALNRSDEDLLLMKESVSKQTVDGWEADYQFHMAIVKAAGNQIMIQLMQFISAATKKAMMNFHQYIQQNENTVKTIIKQHDQIYESIKTGNPEKANEAMIEHLNYVEELLQVSILGQSSRV